MGPDELNLLAYRLLAGAIALAMAMLVLRAKGWREQLYGAMVFIPFALRALGIK